MKLHKRALMVRIEPYEKLIEQGFSLAKDIMGESFFSGIEKIVVEPGQPGHYGKVESDKGNTIYIAGNRIYQEFPDEEDKIRHIAETIVHEMGHVKSHFAPGEGSAEAAERDFISRLQQRDRQLESQKKAFLVQLANSLDASGFFVSANIVDFGIGIKTAEPYFADPQGYANAIVTVINTAIGTVADESRYSFKNSMRDKIKSLYTEGLNTRHRNPSAAIGAVSSLLKNMLAGQNPASVQLVLAEVLKKIS